MVMTYILLLTRDVETTEFVFTLNIIILRVVLQEERQRILGSFLILLSVISHEIIFDRNVTSFKFVNVIFVIITKGGILCFGGIT